MSAPKLYLSGQNYKQSKKLTQQNVKQPPTEHAASTGVCVCVSLCKMFQGFAGRFIIIICIKLSFTLLPNHGAYLKETDRRLWRDTAPPNYPGGMLCGA